uniref:DUF4005 domain-containing protein n=1 Tax=Chenopodium quinoa TaxID=63459 RepID=A0A803L2C8_CHEQI
MGKNGGSSSWFSAVKKAFRSPSKEKQNNSDKRSCRSEDLEQQEQEKQRRGKRRWMFGKPLNTNDATKVTYIKNHASENAGIVTPNVAAEEERKNAIETRPCILVKENQAAVIIQKAFRGYLARRALRALKGLVKLQALVRGHNVRKRTTLTLTRMQAIFRVQARVCDQRRRLSVSREGSLSSSSFTDKIPLSKDGEWDEFQSVEKEIDSSSILGMTQEDVWESERELAYAFSDKMWKSRMKESDEKLDGAVDWREAIRWERPGRYSCDQRLPIKLHQVDYANHRSSFHKIREKNPYQQIKLSPYSSFQTPKPHQPELKHLQVHSASPRCMRQQEPIYLKSQTPRLSCSYRNNTAVPSYMADTASAKARIRSQSVPREQRPSTPEREGIGIPKRRLFFGSSEEVASPSCRNTPRVQR